MRPHLALLASLLAPIQAFAVTCGFDGETGSVQVGGMASSGMISTVTPTSNEVLIVITASNNPAFNPVSTVTDTSSNTWHLLKKIQYIPQAGEDVDFEIWWTGPVAAGAITTTVTWSTGTRDAVAAIFGIEHANNPASPFDPAGTLPSQNSGSASQATVDMTTSVAADYLLTFCSNESIGGACPTIPETGWTFIVEENLSVPIQAVSATAYGKAVSTTQAGSVNVGAGTTPNPWVTAGAAIPFDVACGGGTVRPFVWINE